MLRCQIAQHQDGKKGGNNGSVCVMFATSSSWWKDCSCAHLQFEFESDKPPTSEFFYFWECLEHKDFLLYLIFSIKEK